MKTYPMTITLSGKTKYAGRILRRMNKGRGRLGGYTEYVLNPEGFRVWINARAKDREFVDSFFHEMTHVACRLLKVKFNKQHEEQLCSWIGYVSKMAFAEKDGIRFGRKV